MIIVVDESFGTLNNVINVPPLALILIPQLSFHSRSHDYITSSSREDVVAPIDDIAQSGKYLSQPTTRYSAFQAHRPGSSQLKFEIREWQTGQLVQTVLNVRVNVTNSPPQPPSREDLDLFQNTFYLSVGETLKFERLPAPFRVVVGKVGDCQKSRVVKYRKTLDSVTFKANRPGECVYQFVRENGQILHTVIIRVGR